MDRRGRRAGHGRAEVALDVGGEDRDAAAEKPSARSCSVTVLPVPVAPAIRPCRLAMPSSRCWGPAGLAPTRSFSSNSVLLLVAAASAIDAPCLARSAGPRERQRPSAQGFTTLRRAAPIAAPAPAWHSSRMGTVELLGLAASVSLLAGWRLYLCVFVTGIAMRSGRIDLPTHLDALGTLANPWVMGAAALGLVAEFFADKVAWLDSAWDAVHSFVRPAGAPCWRWRSSTPRIRSGRWSPSCSAAAALR